MDSSEESPKSQAQETAFVDLFSKDTLCPILGYASLAVNDACGPVSKLNVCVTLAIQPKLEVTVKETGKEPPVGNEWLVLKAVSIAILPKSQLELDMVDPLLTVDRLVKTVASLTQTPIALKFAKGLQYTSIF